MRPLILAAALLSCAAADAAIWPFSSDPPEQAPVRQPAPPAAVAQPQAAPQPEPHITAEDSQDIEIEPRFLRTYTEQITSSVFAKIEATTGWYERDRRFSGMLRQSDGKFVAFDPDDVADTILNPVLVPLVHEFVARARKLDKAYMDGNPDTVTDPTGRKWRLVPSS